MIRRALPAVEARAVRNPPKDGLEAQIAAVWEKVLKLRGISRDENFFHIGGNSLLAVRMQAELARIMNYKFSIAEFYHNPTIQALASGGPEDSILQASIDSKAGLGDLHPVASQAELGAVDKVLLTGASGFLGLS